MMPVYFERPGPPPGVDLVTQAELDAAVAGTVPVYNVTAYGAAGDGTTEDYTAVMAAVQAAYDAGGGTVFFPKGTYKISTVIEIPNTGGAAPQNTQPITLEGAGSAQWSGWGTAGQIGGTVLDLRATDTYGKIKTKGVGLLTIRGLTFRDGASTTTPFLYTTNTALHVSGCAFIGSKTTGWDQDCIILGGTTAAQGNAYTDGFQGYGTVIQNNYFNRIRRAVYGRTYFNGNVIRDNTVWAQSGNSAGGAFEIDGAAVSGSDYAVGNVLSGNLIEMVGYKYGISLTHAFGNTLSGNNFFDTGGSTTASVILSATTLRNTVIQGYDASTISDAGDTNLIITSKAGGRSYLGPTSFLDTSYDTVIRRLKVTGGNADTFTIQPAVATSDAGNLINVKRSAAESSNPGADVFNVRQRGDVDLCGANAGTVYFKQADGTALSSFSNAGKTWAAAGTGGNMKIDSGSGGSYLTLQNYGVKLLDQAGANEVRIFNKSGTPEGAIAAPVGSLYLRTDGGANTTLYIKESGTGNTGWVAK